MSLSRKYLDALAFASHLHRAQQRKGTRTPYVTHLMAVSTLVMEYGGDEQQAIAGLLHDAIEDQAESFGGAGKLRREIRHARSIVADHRRIGDRVFERFSASKRDTLWYYAALARTYQRYHAMPAAIEFAATVRQLRKMGRA